jgi:hypothetical protein
MKSVVSVFVLALAVVAAAEQKACCMKQKSGDEEFLALAAEMSAKAEGKKVAFSCPKPTKEAKATCGEEMTGEAAYKVFIANEGYRFYGCSMMALKGREDLMAQGLRVGPVQQVNKGRAR